MLPEAMRSKLTEYFASREEVAFAFAFGSRVKGGATAESDLDVAVYMRPDGDALEWEETRDYPAEHAIWGDLERFAGIETDLVMLNRAPATVADAALREGDAVIVNDRALYLRYWTLISALAEDFREDAEEFWKMKSHPASLSEADRHRLLRALDFIGDELSDRALFLTLDRSTYETDSSARRNVERWIENLVNASIDIAKIVLASTGSRIPQTYRNMLERLGDFEGLDANDAERLAEFSRLRNLLARDYLDVRFPSVRRFVDESEPLFRRLIHFVENVLSEREGN